MLGTSHTAWEAHTESFAPGQHRTERQRIVCCAQGKSSPDVNREDEDGAEVQGKVIFHADEIQGMGMLSGP